MTPRAPFPPSQTHQIFPSSPRKRTLLWDWTSVRDSLPLPPLPPSTPIAACHNWNTWAPPGLPPHIPFRPMFRTLAQLQFPEFEYALSQPHAVMHFLNEPERAGVSPAKAVELWFDKIVPLRRGRGCKIVGPAAASDAQGTDWVDRFMALLLARDPKELPDFLGLHYYGTRACEAIAYLAERHQKYPSLPVNVSEIASISRDRDEVVRFTKELAAWADGTEWIAEYGFFGMMRECADDFVSPAAQLMNEEGGLTALGQWLVGVKCKEANAKN